MWVNALRICLFSHLLVRSNQLTSGTLSSLWLFKNLSLIDTFLKLMVTLEKLSGYDESNGMKWNRLKMQRKALQAMPNNIIIHFVTEIVWHLCSFSFFLLFSIVIAFSSVFSVRTSHAFQIWNVCVCVCARWQNYWTNKMGFQ